MPAENLRTPKHYYRGELLSAEEWARRIAEPDHTSAIMDFPTAWAFVRETEMTDHHEECSYRTHDGGFLCDCDVLWDEYERRGGTRPSDGRRSTDGGSDG